MTTDTTTPERTQTAFRRIGVVLALLALLGHGYQLKHHSWRHGSHHSDGSRVEISTLETPNAESTEHGHDGCCGGHDTVPEPGAEDGSCGNEGCGDKGCGDEGCGDKGCGDEGCGGDHEDCRLEKAGADPTDRPAPPALAALRRFAKPRPEQLQRAHRIETLSFAPKQSPPALV